MSENRRLQVLKNIAGCLLLVSVLHYVLDKPTRPPLIDAGSAWLIRALFERPTPLPPSSRPSDDLPVYHPRPVGVLDYHRLLGDPSFELWNTKSYPTLQSWFSSLTVSAWDVVKRETGIVRHE